MTERKLGRPTKYKPEFGERIIELMSQGYSLAAAAADLEVGRSTVYKWIDEHPDFAGLVEIAKVRRLQKLETDLLETKLGPVVTSRIFALKNASPDWREKSEVEHTGKLETETTHKIDTSGLSDAELEIFMRVIK